MKKYWPVFLTLICWVLILAVPATRLGTYGAWTNWNLITSSKGQTEEQRLFGGVSQATFDLVEQYPNDGEVELFAAARSNDDMFSTRRQFDVNYLSKKYPDNLYIARLNICMSIQLAMDRITYNKTAPKAIRSTPAEIWKKYISDVERYRQLEPQNSYFDWMLLYALLWTDQNDRARAVLKSAARKNVFDVHMRDGSLIRLKMYRSLYGDALSPLAFIIDNSMLPAKETIVYSRVTSQIMRLARYDRKQGNHARAFETSLDLLNLCRTMRDKSHTIPDAMLVGFNVRTCLTSSSVAPRSSAMASARYENNPRSLYAYAREQGRNDIAKLAKSEWTDFEKKILPSKEWSTLIWNARNADRLVLLFFTDRLRASILWTLPLATVLCLFAGLLMWRFPVRSLLEPQFRRGAALGGLLLLLATGGMTFYSSYDNWTIPVEFYQIYVSNMGWLLDAPTWLLVGIPTILLFLAFNRAGLWQIEQQGQRVSTLTRIKNLAKPAEDGLARFDFAWAAGSVLRLTYWLAVAFAVGIFSRQQGIWEEFFQTNNEISSRWFMIVALALSFCALLFSWLNRPKRVETLRLSFQTAFQILAGYIVMASVFYTMVTFATLPASLNLTADFERTIEQGEYQLLLAEQGMGH